MTPSASGRGGGPDPALAPGPAAAADRAPSAAPDRLCSPEETLARVRPHLAGLGITRVGLVTGLDVLGVPVGMAVRPNGFSLSVHQGKGLTDAAAMVSAAMEAAEVALAERAGLAAETMTAAEAAMSGAPLMPLARLTRCRMRRVDPERPLPLVLGRDLATGAPRRVPTALVSIDHTDPAPDEAFDRSSDGLASGNGEDEAVLHALYELVERDAAALARARRPEVLAGRRRSAAAFGSDDLSGLEDRIRAAGLGLVLLDVTSDIGLPVVAAMIAPADAGRRPDLTPAAFCGGFACHHDPAVAAVRAVLEACQARATAIAGARDDIGADWYRLADAASGPAAGLVGLLAAPAAAEAVARPALGPVASRIADLIRRLAARGMPEAVAVPIAAPPGLHVVRVLVPGLEIGPGAPGRRAGPRLLASLLGAA